MKGKGLGKIKHFINQFSLEDAGLPKPVKDLLEKSMTIQLTLSRSEEHQFSNQFNRFLKRFLQYHMTSSIICL